MVLHGEIFVHPYVSLCNIIDPTPKLDFFEYTNLLFLPDVIGNVCMYFDVLYLM
jgi:hypothetical protein